MPHTPKLWGEGLSGLGLREIRISRKMQGLGPRPPPHRLKPRMRLAVCHPRIIVEARAQP